MLPQHFGTVLSTRQQSCQGQEFAALFLHQHLIAKLLQRYSKAVAAGLCYPVNEKVCAIWDSVRGLARKRALAMLIPTTATLCRHRWSGHRQLRPVASATA